ncbi:MAG TPA: hypothetical protein VFJ17_06175 [Mycobacteriales bacterium]|jgi:hypothetical protein|nr:hypothetical protein [Mycobacteriales bacterium]
MTAGFVTARAAQLDDVAISVSVVRYIDGPAVVRIDLEQLALDGKSYVDLSVADALWLQDAVLAATRDVGLA